MTARDADRAFLPSQRAPRIAGLAAVALLVATLGVWGTQTVIDGAVVASGRVIVERNRQAVQHPDGGVVAAVLVREGQTVAQGDVLVRLDPTVPRAELAVTESQLAELMARRSRLTAERDDAGQIVLDPELQQAAAADPAVAELVAGQQSLFDARLATFRQSVAQMETQVLQLQNQVAGIDAVDAALTRQIALADDELTTQQDLLARGLAPSGRVLALRRESARLAGASGETAAQRAEVLERIAEIRIALVRLRAQRREDSIATLRDLNISEMETRAHRTEIQTRLDRMEIRAPVPGVVYDIRLLGERTVLRPADPLLFILPSDRPLFIEARVSPVDVASVRSGQQVVVRFPAFDLRQTPDLTGEVTQISPDALADPATNATFYRIEIELPKAEIDRLGPDRVILPGMPADVFLQTGEYTPLAYLLRPITRYFGTALRGGN